jgi:ribonuclease HI
MPHATLPSLRELSVADTYTLHSAHHDCPTINSVWSIYCDAATVAGNPSSRAATGIVVTSQATDDNGDVAGPEIIHGMFGSVLVGESISSNLAEMRAVLHACRHVAKHIAGPVTIYSDSRYAVNSINNRKMHSDTALAWTAINRYASENDIEVCHQHRDTDMLKLADFVALMSTTVTASSSWVTRDGMRSMLDVFASYRPRG